MLAGRRKLRKTIDVVRLSWLEDKKYTVVYYRYEDAGVLFYTLARLIRNRIDYSLKVKRERRDDVE